VIGAGLFRSVASAAAAIKADILALFSATSGGALVGFTNGGAGAAARTVQNKLRERISVKDFGAVGDGVTDDSVAILAADAAAGVIGAASGRYPSVHFPAGTYACNSLQWGKVASWIGEEVGNTRLLYNGPDNTAGSYIVGLAAGAGAVPYAGFYNLTFQGYDSANIANPAAAHCILNLGTNLDWGFKLENISCTSCFDDALQLRGAASTFVNLYLNRIRFDAVGGFGVYIGSNNLNSGSPFVLDQFTLDNNIAGNFAAKMTGQGRYDGTRWGKGVVRIEDGQGVGAFIGNARVELNKKLIAHNGGFAIIYSNQTIAGTRCIVEARNIQGTGRADQPLIFCRDVTGRTDFRWSGIGMSSYGKLLEASTAERDVYRNQVATGFSNAIVTQQLGLGVYGHSLEWRTNPPEQVAGNFASYKYGDVVFNSTSGPGKPIAWGCKTPTTGYAMANANNATAAAVVRAADNVVDVPAAVLANLSVGLNVTLVGAGAAGADLDTRITAVDEVNNKVTVADVPATAVNPATIRYKVAAFAPILYAQGVSADKGNANFTLTLGSSEPTAWLNTPLTANRTVTLAVSAANVGTTAQAWGRFRVVRSAASTGAFTLDVGGLKSLAAGQWCDIEWNGAAWVLTAAGSL
jgi:hypothetical protein